MKRPARALGGGGTKMLDIKDNSYIIWAGGSNFQILNFLNGLTRIRTGKKSEQVSLYTLKTVNGTAVGR